MELRPASEQDLEPAVQLHGAALGRGLFPRLGRRFMSAYYATFLDSPHGVALVCVHEGRLLAVLVGTTAHAAHHRWILRHRFRTLALRGAVALAARPRLAAHFVRSRSMGYLRSFLRLRRRAAAPEAGEGREPAREVAVLTHLAVVEDQRGRGLGRALTDAYLEIARAAGAAEAHVVTPIAEHGAEAFYEQTGWQRTGRHTSRDGAEMVAFRRRIRASSEVESPT